MVAGRKYSDKFMFLVNLLQPTSLSQVIFPQNMRNLSERYLPEAKLKMLFNLARFSPGFSKEDQQIGLVCHIVHMFNIKMQ